MRALIAFGVMACGAGSANAQGLLDSMLKCADRRQAAAERVVSCSNSMRLAKDKSEQAALLSMRSEARLSAGDFDGAIADADAAEKLLPANIELLNAKCWSRAVANRDLDVARAACDAALAKENWSAAHDSRGLVGLRQGRWSEAWEDYDSAVSSDPSLTLSLYGRGLAALALGRTPEGEDDIAKASASAEEFLRLGLTPDSMRAEAPPLPDTPLTPPTPLATTKN